MANKNFVVRHGLEVSGNSGVAGNLGVSGTLSVGGNTNLDGTLGVSGLLSVGGGGFVSGPMTLGSDITHNGNSDINGSLQVSGNASFGGNTSVGGKLTVSGHTNLNRSLQVSGNSSLAGTLQVKGNTSLGANLNVAATLSVGGNTNIVGVTTIGGNTDINGTLQASGNVSAGGGLVVTGNSDLNGTLQVSGNTTISGKLTVPTGASTIAAATFDNGWFRIGNTTAGIAMDPNEIYFAGEGNVGTISGSLTLSPANGQILAGSRTLSIQTIDATGNIQTTAVISGTQLRTASFRTTGTLNVQGGSYLSGAVNAKSNVSIGGVLTVTSSTNLLANTAVAGTLSVQGGSYLSGSVQAKGILSSNQLRATSSNVAGTLTVQGASYLSGTVQAKGVISGSQLRCASLRVTGGTAAICGSMDICGSLQVGGFISANTYNFEMFGAVPAYNNSDYSTINWSIANSAIQLRSSTDTSIGMAFPAFRVNSAASVLGRWRITIQVKASAAATSGLYIRVYEYDGELPNGKVAVSNDAINSVVQEDTRQGVTTGTVENVAIGTDWVTKTFYYSPTATAVYASVVVLNWTGIGTNHLYVRPPVIQPEYSGFVSATTLRTSSLRVTGNGTAAICGSMDISGSLQVAAVLSAGQGRLTSARLQRGNISAMTFLALNGTYVSATTVRTTSLRVATTGYVCGSFNVTGTLSGGQLRCASLRVTGNGTAAICGGMDISGSLQVAGLMSAGQIRGVSGAWQRDSVSLRVGTGVATYDKIRVWSGAQYTIGMTQGLTFGGLGNDYAMTFTMNNDVSRGFLWRHDTMTAAQGAMSLTTAGQLTVAAGVRIGFGQADVTAPASNGMQVNGSISCDAIHAGASAIQTTGIISGSQLRCSSLRVTGGIAAICGSMDICGSLQVAGFLSCNGLHAAASSIQTTGTISGSIINAGQLRCTSFKSEERLTVSSTGTTGNTIEVRAGGSGNHFLLYQYATNQQYGGTMHIATAHRTNTTAFQFYGAYSNNGGDTEYVLRGQGQASADGAWYGGGVDYAEYFEWKDGNPNNEARFGQPVYLISGEKVALATSGNIPIGVVSKNPVVVGGSAWNKWEHKYLKDEWNDYIRNADGERILNPDYDPDREYIPREDRSEWDAIGLMGKLPIQKEYITDTIRNNTNWMKMSNINDNVERWLIK